MILYYKEEGYTSLPVEQVEYKRIENKHMPLGLLLMVKNIV